MADWYVSSVAYAALPQFAISTAYTVGQIIRPLATPTLGKMHAFRCTTAGTSAGTEPTWPTANNSTVTSGGATFTNVTAQSTYNWGAPAGDLVSISTTAGWNRPVVGDRVFLSSDHSESLNTGSAAYAFSTTHAYGLIQVISVNRAGSVPPVAADITSGAAITWTGTGLNNLSLEAYCNMFWQGITFTNAGAPTTNGSIGFAGTGRKAHYLKDCALVLANTTGTGGCIGFSTNQQRVIFDNTTVKFQLAAQYMGPLSSGDFELTWINTPNAIQGATIPTTLFQNVSGASFQATCRGVDLSAITGTLAGQLTSGFASNKVLLDSCKIASGVARITASPGTNTSTADEIELVNCYDGTNVINERYTSAGAITTDRSTTLSGGAQDDIGDYSLKLVSSSRSDISTFPLDCFTFDVENTSTGSSKTATVEIISSGSLNNNDIRLQLQYMGTSGNPVASFIDSLATALTTAAALPSSSVTWNNAPSTPQKQYLQVTFTPQRAGRVRGLVRLGKVSSTVWVNPQIAIA